MKPWLILAVTAMGTFMSTLDSSIVNVALPMIADELAVSIASIQWIVTAYLLAISSLLLPFGRLGDAISRRSLYSFGIFLFTLGSWGCGFSTGLNMLIFFRVVQGIGAGCMMANSPAIVASAFPGPQRGRALGLLGTIVALGTMTGPVLGGFILEQGAWPWVFLMNIPLGILGMAMAWFCLPDSETRPGIPNLVSTFWLALTVIFMMLFLLQGWLIFFPLTLLSCGCFVYFEKHSAAPVLDPKLWRNHLFVFGTGASFFSFMAIFSNIILLPFYLYQLLQITPAQMGWLMTPFPLMMAFCSPVGGYLSEKANFVKITTAGLVVLTLGLLWTLQFQERTSLWEVALGQALMGIGTGLFQSANNNSILSTVSPEQLGLAAGISALVRNLGMVTGVALAVTIFNGLLEYTSRNFLSAYHIAMACAAGYASVALWLSCKRKTEVL